MWEAPLVLNISMVSELSRRLSPVINAETIAVVWLLSNGIPFNSPVSMFSCLPGLMHESESDSPENIPQLSEVMMISARRVLELNRLCCG